MEKIISFHSVGHEVTVATNTPEVVVEAERVKQGTVLRQVVERREGHDIIRLMMRVGRQP